MAWLIGCDWGTSRMRLRAVAAEEGAVAVEFVSDDGVARIAQSCSGAERPNRYRALLAAGLRPLAARLGSELAAAPIIVSGMASSSIGWQELPYAGVPARLDGSTLVAREFEPMVSEAGSHRVVLTGGVRTATDVMRGEETELAGLFTLAVARPLAGGSLVIKPGTHSKHVRVEHGSIADFTTYMTGELFDVLGKASVLEHSIAAAESDEPALGGEAAADFRQGVRDAQARPLGAALFRVRTRQLLDRVPRKRNRAYLSGVLVGSELSGLADAANLPLVLCASEAASAHYRAALDELGHGSRLTVVEPAEVERLSARGQAHFWRGGLLERTAN